MTGNEKTGFPWLLIIQIVQAVLAILTYLAAREKTGTANRAELVLIRRDLDAAFKAAAPKAEAEE